MASSLILRRSSSLFNKLINPSRCASVVPCVSRSFNTNAEMTTFDEGDRNVDIDRRPDRSVSRRGDSVPGFFSDPFGARSLSQVLNLMDQVMDNSLMNRRGWDVKEDNEGLYLRMDMPGLDKNNVKVSVEQNSLVIRGEVEGEDDERRYSSRIDLPVNVYKVDEIQAEMKNGVLKVRVPKVSEEERKDVFQVQIE